mmetsp:Transcript_46521/g.68769  ORF Transcript_46521/g.68769 Transcript_46521/m.68769 type:complete len:242 (+) Transcript_46521:102-827(+)|eukprot:CAMPEP_0195507584 /NCGR_PEP_ID=MMETSP0794_2-20130614/1007_1 /TAXON_ID=515487 /ORGANISM="Stephanopyxis turris, Strain CCMP 815" /LENGTH=241 /DNA_ID=CAMNT_0040634319 /DNA_START=74 /DNA_END=799 /DNA_ORIENTATION=-
MSHATNMPMHSPTTFFEVRVARENFKFNAAHFVAFKGFRERLHGHNYQVGVRLLGSRHICSDGYVLDFGDVKKVIRAVCKKLNEYFICPTLSNVLDIKIEKDEDGNETNVKITCEDGTKFSFPRGDCAMLPIVHVTAEELAIYIWGEILRDFDRNRLLGRGIHTMEVRVTEAPGQEAVFGLPIPSPDDEQGTQKAFDVAGFITGHNLPASPCPSAPGSRDIVNNNKLGKEPEACGKCESNH